MRPVGGVVEKLYAARQAGMRAILVPKENAREIDAALTGIEVVAVSGVEQASAGIAYTQALHKAFAGASAQGAHASMSTQPFPSPIDRIPPHNLEAEMALLGSILVDKR